MGRLKRKCAFEHAQNVQILMRMFSLTLAFVLHSYILLYPMILLTDREGPDQTARMRRLIWAFAVRICLKTRFRIAGPIFITCIPY